MPLRETRRFKTKGFAISFGDFMLPLVGLAAIGLLFVAGKFFFFSDFQADRQQIVSIAPPDLHRVDAEESGATVAARNPNHSAAAEMNPNLGRSNSNINENINQNSAGIVTRDEEHDNRNHAASHQNATSGSVGAVGENAERETAREIIVVSAPEPEQRTNPNPEPVQTAQPAQAYWMVQIGAFSTNAAAQTALRRVVQDGHRATIVSGNRWHRVMVYAGPTNQDAVNLAAQLNRSGYVGAFTVPPARR